MSRTQQSACEAEALTHVLQHVAQLLVVSESASDDDDDDDEEEAAATGSELLIWAYCKTFSGLAHVEKCLVDE